jgi:hypothetical protein
MKIAHLFLLAAVIGVGACSESGRERPPQTSVRVFNVAPRFESVSFYREQRLEFSPSFMQAGTLQFDSGAYDFRIQHASLAQGSQIVDQEFALDLAGDLDYWFIIAAPNDQPEAIIASWPESFSSTTSARFQFAHANPMMGPLDVYVVVPGANPGTTTPQGSIDFRDSTPTFEVAAGQHRMYLTTAGDPTDIVFESMDFEIPAGRQAFVVVSDGTGEYGDNVVVSDIFGALASRIFAFDETNELRVIQSIDDRLDRDVLFDQASPPLFTSLPFGDPSAHAAVAAGSHELSVTPPGNPGAIEYSEEFAIIAGRQHTVLFAGDTSTGLDGAMQVEDRRSIIDQATVWFLNGASLFSSVLVYVTAPGTDLSTIEPTALLTPPEVSAKLRYVPSTLELTVLDIVTGATLLGPQAITLENGGVYNYLLVNSAGGSTVDMIRID